MITKEDVEDSITYKLTGALMMTAGLLSDAQELLSMGANAQSNEAINDAKRVIFMVMDGELDPGIRK
jgi:predicted GTPase